MDRTGRNAARQNANGDDRPDHNDSPGHTHHHTHDHEERSNTWWERSDAPVGVIECLGGSSRVSSRLDSTDMSNSNEHTHRSTYTVEEVAHILGISRTTAYECVRRGDIQARRFGRRVVGPTIVVDRLLHGTDDRRPDDAVPGREI